MVTAILLGSVVSHSFSVRLPAHEGRQLGTHAQNGRKQKPRLSGSGQLVNAATLRTASHTASTAVQIAVDHHRPQFVDEGVYPQAIFTFRFRTLTRTQRCNYKTVIP